jgi:predicted RNase H-like HicB family nuclease
MKVEKVLYQRIFPLSPYVNEKVGIEIIVEDGESASECLDAAKETVEAWHKSNIPPQETYDAPIPEESLPVIDVQDIHTVDKIEDCTTLEELASFKPNVTQATYPAYMKKMKELTNSQKAF